MREFENVRKDEPAIQLYETLIRQLESSGLVALLRAKGRPKLLDSGKDITVLASHAAWCAGWNDCLDLLLELPQVLSPVLAAEDSVRADFGSLNIAVQNKNLTKEEADALKRGERVSYPVKDYSGNITVPPKRE